VWAWGYNSYGELGDGTTTSRSSPVPAIGLIAITAVSAGGRGSNYFGGTSGHTIALKADGSVWAWGQGSHGEIGDGTYVPRNRPAGVAAVNGLGSLDTNDWYLDLDPATPVVIPTESVPKMLAVSRFLGTGAFDSTVKYKSSEFGQSVNNFVLALVPPEFFNQVKTAPGSATAEQLRAKAGKTLVFAQLTPQGWTNVQGQLIAYSQGVASAAGGAANILSGVNTTLIPGARFCIGYGESADAMLTSQALREVLVLEGASATVSDLACVLSGVYVEGPRPRETGLQRCAPRPSIR